jgi:hypothetical protein
MKNKTGRPRILDDSPKSILVGARVSKKEEQQIEREAEAAGQTKSELVRERLLGPTSQLERADLRKLWCPAKILTLDGQEIATGLIKLRTAPALGVFLPNHPPFPLLDIPKGTKLVAEVGIHRFDLLEWEYCGAMAEVTSEGVCHLGQHYHFECPLQ